VDNLLKPLKQKQERGSNKHADWLNDNKAKRRFKCILGLQEPPRAKHAAELVQGVVPERRRQVRNRAVCVRGDAHEDA